ncbi:MAG: DUF4326 domain-containing protein [Alphaproteobacteria bacterium]|nr:DUF4326 domain-containing protein [Alphaproteobacteria bacterium]
MPSTPVRLRLSRRRGFRLQDISLATNSRSAAIVARPSKWGNPFSVQTYGRESAIAKYETYLQQVSGPGGALDPAELRGKNLACWCALDQACHADVLLRWANRCV